MLIAEAATAPGRRITLRSVREGESAEIERWYSEAAAAAYESRSLEELCAEASNLLAVMRPAEDKPIGLIEYKTGKDRLTIGFIALAKVYRGWGYGSEAVRLLEDEAARASDVKRFRAQVDIGNGLGLYFWLRLGYRPSESGRDSLTMLRSSG